MSLFDRGWGDPKVTPRYGQPRLAVTDNNIACAEALIGGKTSITLQMQSGEFRKIYYSVHIQVHEQLTCTKRCAHLTPHQSPKDKNIKGLQQMPSKVVEIRSITNFEGHPPLRMRRYCTVASSIFSLRIHWTSYSNSQ